MGDVYKRQVKTDQIDAMQIALYGLAYWQELQPTRLPENTYRELQLLARQYYQTVSYTHLDVYKRQACC